MSTSNFNIKGLSQQEVLAARVAFGPNQLQFKKQHPILDALKSLGKEPMVVLLFAAAIIYFVSGQTGDGIFMAAAIVLVAAISLYQDARSRNALEKLKEFTQPQCKVIREGQLLEIPNEELVMGDALLIEEGKFIAADGKIIHSNDFSVNQSVLTGESMAVYKDRLAEDPMVYRGTIVASGLAIATITAVGNETQLGKIGLSIENIADEKTPLEIQIDHFVKKMVLIGAIVFLIVWVINYVNSHLLLDSLLKALTLAMSILPEEIPVAFTTFMALGAWRLMKMGIVVKQMKTVETLGSATVICTDKTGTLTLNKMSLAKIFVLGEEQPVELTKALTEAQQSLIRLAMFASEPIAFDPMEQALHQAYDFYFLQNRESTIADERRQFIMVHEYPLDGKPPMMTHFFEDANGHRIVAAKGAPEAIMAVAALSDQEKNKIEKTIQDLALEGYRILAVAESSFQGNDFPAAQQSLPFQMKGLVAFYDPPKENIHAVLESFAKAGIEVKIVTGDNSATTQSIAKQIGFRGTETVLTGDELMELSDESLAEKINHTHIFTRMFPDAKMRIINSLKANQQIVAMTGDGVNDGPALKAAHIGIAMGQKGTEIAKQAASLILLEDDLSKMVEAIAMGRRIYSNLKKAIQYIISIHIPIVLTVFIPLALGWIYPNIFTPVHIIFLELIMGPTCSIIYENEPMEKNTMLQQPRPFTNTFFNSKELLTSVIQGIAITAGTLTAYQYAVSNLYNEATTRTMVFCTLIAANIFLTLVNRSFYYSLFSTLKYKNNLVTLIIFITIFITALLVFVNPMAQFFSFTPLTINQLLISLLFGFISVSWFELVKWYKRKKHPLA